MAELGHEPRAGQERCRRSAACVLRRAADGLLPRRLLRHGARGRGQPHGVLRGDGRVPRVRPPRRQRSLDAATGVGVPRATAGRSLVRLRRTLARGSSRGLRTYGRARRDARASTRRRADRPADRARGRVGALVALGG